MIIEHKTKTKLRLGGDELQYYTKNCIKHFGKILFKEGKKVVRRKNLLLFILTLFCLYSVLTVVYAYDKTYTTYMAGNSHIDTAWQWTTATTINSYIPNTFNQAINLMNSNSDYTFNASASIHYKWTKQYYPSLYSSIVSKVASGQWALVGGQYLEPDLNMASGEALVRQSLFGQRFFQQEFGKKCTVGFVPDVFGFSGQLPQILKKSGMDYFITTKLNWNDTNAFPYEIFKWNGVDGSQVISYKPRQDYSTGVDRTNINSTLDEPNRHSIKKGVVLYGSGDSGGGPTQSQIDSIRSLDADGTMPNVKMYSVNKYFSDLTTTDKNNITDAWDGEMYLENHRGTYTSQALIKKNNRFGEIAAEEAEKLSSMANWLGATGYPQTDINNAWEKVMKNQFHDILPGSGTGDNVAESWLDGQAALDALASTKNTAMSGITTQADTSGNGVPIVVFNTLSFGRRQPVETSVTFSSAPTSVRVYDPVGTEIPSQVLSINGNTAKIVFIADQIPSIGFRVYRAESATAGSYNTGLTIGSNVIESDVFRVEINGTTGNISRIYDKVNAREVLSGGEGNVLQILDDTPAQWDAWNVDYDDMTRTPLSTLGSTTGISIVEQGPVKATYRINKSYGSSTFSQYITLYPNINRIDIRMTANWQESHKMLKVAFPWNVSGATEATYEIAYGSVTRSNQRDTNFNKARFEVSAHKWADLSNGGYGVSLLNNCKYGYDTYLNTMRLSLLRSPKSPDANCDMGSHEFTYSIYPHSGDWKSANTVYKGYELNYPLQAYPATAHTGSLGKSYSFMSVNQPNVIISVVKKAEDSNNYILRLYESQGSTSTNVTVTVPGTISALYETNLLEENLGTAGYSGNTFSTTLGKYEIKTFKVNCGGSWPTAPAPSGNRCIGGTITASGENTPNEGKDRAFDGNYSTKWLAFSSTGWLQYDFAGTSTYAINQYSITSANDYSSRDPKNWTLKGSNDGSSWTTVDTRTNVTFANRFQKQTFSFTNSYLYQMYRLEISANNGGGELQIGEVEMFGPASGATPTPGPTPTPTPTPIQVSLSSYYNQDGFSYDTNRTNGAYDPGASPTSCYSADLLNSNPSYDGVPYTLGPKTDSSNNEIKGTGQTITLTQGQYSSVRFLGSSTNGDKTGTFRINYTDGTYDNISVTEKDWCTSSTSGQKIVQSMAHRHQGSNDQTINTYVFAYYLTDRKSVV